MYPEYPACIPTSCIPNRIPDVSYWYPTRILTPPGYVRDTSRYHIRYVSRTHLPPCTTIHMGYVAHTYPAYPLTRYISVPQRPRARVRRMWRQLRRRPPPPRPRAPLPRRASARSVDERVGARDTLRIHARYVSQERIPHVSYMYCARVS